VDADVDGDLEPTLACEPFAGGARVRGDVQRGAHGAPCVVLLGPRVTEGEQGTVGAGAHERPVARSGQPLIELELLLQHAVEVLEVECGPIGARDARPARDHRQLPALAFAGDHPVARPA
jgi:hypothetical protein